MARIKRAVNAQKKRRKMMKLAKGYVGASSSIHQGVTVGDGALVGIGANVIRDVPARAVVAGNPARILRIQP